MTLRDYFAGQAMAAMIANPDYLEVVTRRDGLGQSHQQLVAEMSFKYADAMLKARES
jgi:hypothetical protein